MRSGRAPKIAIAVIAAIIGIFAIVLLIFGGATGWSFSCAPTYEESEIEGPPSEGGGSGSGGSGGGLTDGGDYDAR